MDNEDTIYDYKERSYGPQVPPPAPHIPNVPSSPAGRQKNEDWTMRILLIILCALLGALVFLGFWYITRDSKEKSEAQVTALEVPELEKVVKEEAAGEGGSSFYRGYLEDIPTPIALSLTFDGSDVSGYYYKDANDLGTALPVTGYLSGHNLLIQHISNGRVLRQWDGLIDGGVFSGVYTSGYSGESRSFTVRL